MDYQTMGIIALIALAVALALIYVIGHNYLPALNKFLNTGV